MYVFMYWWTVPHYQLRGSYDLIFPVILKIINADS